MIEGVGAWLSAKAWLLFGALVGSITGAWFVRPKTKREWAATVAGGFFASVFIAPACVKHMLPNAQADDPRVGAIYYAFALLAMVLIPVIMRSMVKRAEKTIGGEP